MDIVWAVLPVEAVTKLSVSLAAIPSPSPCMDPIKRAYVEMVKNVVESEENDGQLPTTEVAGL